MKRSYNLIGLAWDGTPTIPVTIQPNTNLDTIAYAGMPDTLFDQKMRKRIITLSALLDAESKEDIEALTASLQNCDEIYFVLDYKRRSTGTVAADFFAKRIAQMAAYLTYVYPQAKIIITTKQTKQDDAFV